MRSFKAVGWLRPSSLPLTPGSISKTDGDVLLFFDLQTTKRWPNWKRGRTTFVERPTVVNLYRDGPSSLLADITYIIILYV